MKTFLFYALLCGAFSLPIASLTAQDNQTTFEKYLATVYGIYESGGYEALLQYYAPNAAEIDPTGRLTSGLPALRESWKAMESMTEGKPKFTYKLTSWRLVKPDVAVITWDTRDEFILAGQKIISDNTGMALLRKEHDKWLIEFDQLTPKMEFPMPDQQADMFAIGSSLKAAYTALEGHDVEGFAALFSEDAQEINPLGGILDGRAAIKAAHIELFKNYPPHNAEVTKHSIRFLTADVAVCVWLDKETMEIGERKWTEEHSFMGIMQRVNGKWLCTGLTITPVRERPEH